MASRLLLHPLMRPQTMGLGLGVSLFSAFHLQQRPLRLDGPVFSSSSYSENAKTPVLRNGRLNPGAVRQISSGSVIGLCAGLVVSTFSRSLALILGLLVVGVQDNAAFKISFGTVFAMASFMHF